MQTIEEALDKLSKSKFRSSFHLTTKDKEYIARVGLPTVKKHAEVFIRQRLAPAEIPNDGKQTPMRGHPVFKAQHACACCCRRCLEKWYNVCKDKELDISEQTKIVNLLIAWIERQLQ